MNTKLNTWLLLLIVCRIVRFFYSLCLVFMVRWCRSVFIFVVAVTIVIGSYYGRLSGLMSVNDVSAASVFLMARIGNSAAISVGICGAILGEERCSVAIRVVMLRWLLIMLFIICMLDAW